jgi:hypothetical protein
MRMMLEYSLRERDENFLVPYLAAITPFVNAFFYIQSSLGIHYPGLYDGLQAALVFFPQIQPPDTEWEWEMTLSRSEVDNWVVPEIPLLGSIGNWPQILADGHLLPSARTPFDPEWVRTQFVTLLRTIQETDDAELDKLGLQVGILFVFADTMKLEMTKICQDFANVISSLLEIREAVVPKAFKLQATSAILNRCKSQLPLRTRLTQIRGLADSVAQLGAHHLWLTRADPVESLITRLSIHSMHALAGQLTFSLSPDMDDDYGISHLPGGVQNWLEGAIDRLFSEDFGYFERFENRDRCVFYRPLLTGDALSDRDRQIGVGRLLGLYMRNNFDYRKLIPYMRSCEEFDSVETVLFFGSEAIRRGFYSVFSEGDFERALINGRDATAMLLFLSVQPSSFFNLGYSRLHTT